MLLGKPFSFTAHAKDIYEQKLNPGDLLDRKFDSARFAVTCTAANHDHLRSRGIDCTNLHTIYHGLDTSLFSPAENDATNAAPIILAVGRYVEKKGFLDLIAACAQLQQRGVAFAARIVGEEGDAGPAMRDLIARHGLQNVITLAPPAPQKELKEIYARATVFALPCRIADSGDRDGIPNVLAEAMAMELPVVTTDVSGIPELVHHQRTGLLVKPGDPDGLAAALENVLVARPEARAALGRAARAIIKERFDSQTTTLSLKALFDQALVEATA
jgi:glycosyltransferase involved in cell wall biosynthesis